MTGFAFTDGEWLLLTAALAGERDIAAGAWRSFEDAFVLEEAAQPELRLLPAVHANLNNVAPDLRLPKKLRGKARATYARNMLLASGCAPVLEALSREMPVMVTKGAATCMRFGSWSARTMGDIDIQVHEAALPRLCEVLAQAGWSPKYGMTWASLQHRSSLRRNSWNATRGELEIDVHWRFNDEAGAGSLQEALWSGARKGRLLGRDMLVPSPACCVATALQHGFADGTRSDAMQALVDTAWWLPACDAAELERICDLAGLAGHLARAREIVACAASGSPPPSFRTGPAAARARAPARRPRPEAAVLRHPRLYRAWQALGSLPLLDRLMVRLAGPVSRPLNATGIARDSYDLRSCTVIDEIGGPGWSWPEPEHSCFWSDRADNRLLVPLPGTGDHVLLLAVSDHRMRSPNPAIRVYANGHFVRAINLANLRDESEFALVVPRHCLHGPWVELSFRPRPYAPSEEPDAAYARARAVPARTLRVFSPDGIDGMLATSHLQGFVLELLKNEPAQIARLQRIMAKIRQSPHAQDPRLPPEFDPLRYCLMHRDLFESETDPCAHYLAHGEREKRPWR